MHIRIFALTGLLLLANLAQAQTDLTSSRELSGLYFGLAPVLLLDQVNMTSNHLGFTMPDETCNASGSFASFAPSVLMGYVHEFAFGGVTGLELDFSYHTNATLNRLCDCPTNPSVSDRLSFFNQMQGSLRARFGYAYYDLLPFATVGGSIASLGLGYSNEDGDKYAATAAAPGWLVGAGLEWRSAWGLSLRGEYHYVAYNDVNLLIPTIYGLTDSNGAAHASSSAHNLGLAVNYWFW